MTELGLAPTVNNVREIARHYVHVNNHNLGKKMFNYKGVNQGARDQIDVTRL